VLVDYFDLIDDDYFFVFVNFFLALNKFKVPIKTLLSSICYRKK